MTTLTDATEVIELWPDGPPTTIDGVPEEASYTNPGGIAQGSTSTRNISNATLTVFEPAADKRSGLGIIVIPGGGWSVNMWTHEGVDVARWLVGLGHTCFVLKYRLQATEADHAAFEARATAQNEMLAVPLPKAMKPRAISDVISTDAYLQARDAAADDGRRAVAVLRENAERFGLRPGALGMIGFSAGAFLTVDVALDPRGEQVAFAAPIYGGETRGAPVPDDAPPLFLAVALDDVLVNIVEGLHADWTTADRSSELHVYARGQHGFGLVQQKMPSDRWTDAFVAWLDDLALL